MTIWEKAVSRKRKKRSVAAGEGQGLVATAARRFGEGALMNADDDRVSGGVPTFPSGALSLDLALGIGGYPRGRIIEVYGPESSGKTTLMLHAIREAQRAGGMAAFVDAEHALDTGYASKIGVDLTRLLLAQPDSGEQALELVEMIVRSGEVAAVVVDSVAALTPRAEIDGEVGDQHLGLQARMMSQALRKVNGLVNQTGTSLFFINQLRQKIGVQFGSNETTTGGNALKFYASMRLDVRRIATVKDGQGRPIANRVRVRMVKNKLASPFRTAEFEIRYGRGISTAGELVDLGLAHDVIQKSGAWYAWDDERLGQGRERVIERLCNEPKLMERLTERVRLALGCPSVLDEAA